VTTIRALNDLEGEPHANAFPDSEPKTIRSSPLPRRRCSLAVERHAHLIQLYVMLDLGYDLPDIDELLLWASRDPNPHRPRLREQVESGEFG
jgi:hypothetical protein